MHFIKEVLLLPALSNGDEKIVGGLACLLSEIGQAVSVLFVTLQFSRFTGSCTHEQILEDMILYLNDIQMQYILVCIIRF